jgi:hydroxypyruvate isomerase
MLHRRKFVLSMLALSALPTLADSHSSSRELRQGVARSVFGDMPLDSCCRIARSLGIQGFDFIGDPHDWATLRRYGLTMSMLRADFGGGISLGRSPQGPAGWNAIGLAEAQSEYLRAIHDMIDLAAREHFPNVLVLAGSREHVSYEQGADHAEEFLNQIKKHAEDREVTICMENLNSKGRAAPPLSLFDHVSWGVDVVRRVNSPRVKVLYDIWHAQLMDGDIVESLRSNIEWIGHVHTGSVPDRHELPFDDELDYRTIGAALRELGFQGFVTHEWSPSPGSNVVNDLKRSVALMESAIPQFDVKKLRSSGGP